MKKSKKKIFSHIVNILSIALIVECFLCALLLVQKHAKESCFDRIEEASQQVSTMFTHAMNERWDKLTVFADILAANNENPQELLQTYMENFCKTQYFSAICIHRANGTLAAYGDHPHKYGASSSFEEEVSKLPYVSQVFSYGEAPEENFIFQAVPIIRDGETIAVLYGYMSLDLLSDFVVSGAYDGKCQLFVVDSNTGNYLMNGQGTLGNFFETMTTLEVKSGYSLHTLQEDLTAGEHGFFVFRNPQTGEWEYMDYVPLGINNWSMLLTIDQSTAFASYITISHTLLILMIGVILLVIVLIISLMLQNARVRRLDKARLHKTDFINTVQRFLLNAQDNPDFVGQALKTVATEMEAETVLLLSFTDKAIADAQYWPSIDKAQAQYLLGRNLQDEFPTLFDLLCSNQCVCYDEKDPKQNLSVTTKELLRRLDVRRMLLVPILDPVGTLKGAIAAVNLPETKTPDLMKSVTYDFYMAITNLEHQAIIKNMGAMDYLTRTKNRNSYESELGNLAVADCDDLWCIYVDVNCLREINNTHGHKAGDIMLCSVADALKRALGSESTYRLGGDEFISFAMNTTQEALQKKKAAINAELAAKGYSVSLGFCGSPRTEDGVFDLEQIISSAEARMYQEKWAFYQKNNLPSDSGHFPVLQKE